MGTFAIALVSALGASGIAGAAVSWWKDRKRDDVEVTQMIRQMSREEVSAAHKELRELRAEVRDLTAATSGMRDALRELVGIIEHETVIQAVETSPALAARLRLISDQVSPLVA